MRCNWNLGDVVAISSLFEVSVVWVSVHSLCFGLGFFFPLFGLFRHSFSFGIYACLIRRISDGRILTPEKHILFWPLEMF